MIARLAFVALVLALASPADTLRLRSGAVVNGTFLGGTSDDIRFLVNENIEHYPRADVVAIDFGSDGARSAPRDAQPIDVGPDYIGAPFLRGANGYIPLEQETGTMARTGGGMYGGMGGGTVYRIRGARSPVRVRQGDRIVFVIRMRPGDDPPRQFQLFRLESRMGYRQTQPVMGGMPQSLPVMIRNIGGSLYEITPTHPLYPGEYAMSPAGSNESYCLGVDY
jgi:hypothetical protein